MKRMSLTILLALTACSSVTERDQSHAQCLLDANGEKGMTFEKNNRAIAGNDRDAPYRWFMVICMEAKGYKFEAPYNDFGDLNESCFTKEEDAGETPIAIVGRNSCYH